MPRRDGMSTDTHKPTMSWSELALVAASALAVLLAVEVLLRAALGPPRRIMEVNDGVSELELGNPRTLVLGSSHARSFLALEQQLGDDGVLQVVPEEGGTFSAFDWVLEHRLSPLLEARTSEGRYQKDRLERAMLITTYWDMCPVALTDYPTNLAARAWTLRHFLDDVSRNGVTARSRNYPRQRLTDLLSWSWLFSDRGHSTLVARLKAVALGTAWPAPETIEEWRRARIALRRREIEEEGETCRDAAERAALERTLRYLRGRVPRVDLVLFPLAPETLTDISRSTTLPAYRAYADSLARMLDIRVLDLTTGHPLIHDDFEWDMDHLSAQGNARFARWALSGPLQYLHTGSEHDQLTGGAE